LLHKNRSFFRPEKCAKEGFAGDQRLSVGNHNDTVPLLNHPLAAEREFMPQALIEAVRTERGLVSVAVLTRKHSNAGEQVDSRGNLAFFASFGLALRPSTPSRQCTRPPGESYNW